MSLSATMPDRAETDRLCAALLADDGVRSIDGANVAGFVKVADAVMAQDIT